MIALVSTLFQVEAGALEDLVTCFCRDCQRLHGNTNAVVWTDKSVRPSVTCGLLCVIRFLEPVCCLVSFAGFVAGEAVSGGSPCWTRCLLYNTIGHRFDWIAVLSPPPFSPALRLCPSVEKSR